MSFSYVTALLDLVYPPRCPGCQKLTAFGDFCSRCARLLSTIGQPACRYCGKPVLSAVDNCRDCRGQRLYFDSAGAAWIFEGLARDVIHAYKFSNQKNLAPMLAGYLKPLINSTSQSSRIITWVPLTRRKTWSRGYDQAKLLAINLSNQVNIPSIALLRRIKTTRDQNQLDGRLRRINMHGAFEPISTDRIYGADIILIDDVYTTGSTVGECSKILKKSGAGSVHVATLARTCTNS